MEDTDSLNITHWIDTDTWSLFRLCRGEDRGVLLSDVLSHMSKPELELSLAAHGLKLGEFRATVGRRNDPIAEYYYVDAAD